MRAVRVLAALVASLLVAGLLSSGAADARPSFVTTKLPGYCGTVARIYGPPAGISVSSAKDRWKRASGVSCAKARSVARRYIRDVGKYGQGSAGGLKVGRFRCNTNNVMIAQQTGHSAVCASRRVVISFDDPAVRGVTRLPCTAKRLSRGLRNTYTGTSARLVNHRCSGGTAVAVIKYRGKNLRYAFSEFDGEWAAVSVTSSVSEGFSGPSNRMDLTTINALGRSMRGKQVEKYRVGR